MKKLITCFVFLCVLCLWALPAGAATSFYWDKTDLSGNARVYLSPTYNSDESIYALVAEKVYVSQDQGGTWKLISTDPVLYAQVALDNKIYFLVEEKGGQMAIYSYDGVKEDWVRKCNAPANTRVFAVVSNNTLLSARPYDDNSFWQIHRSSDGGVIWEQVEYTRGGLFFVPTGDSNYVYTREINGALCSFSKNGGHSWEEMSRAYEFDSFFVSPNAVRDGKLFAIRARSGVEITYDQGIYWHPLSKGMDLSNPLVDIAFSRNYSNDNTIYTTDRQGRVFVSNTDEVNWRDLGLELPSGATMNNMLTISDTILLAGTSNGVYTTGTTPDKVAIEEATPKPTALTRTMTVQFRLGQPTYTINGREWDMDTAPFLQNDRTYVPVRYLAYGLGISDSDVVWNSKSKEITLTKDSTVVKMKIDDQRIRVNDKEITMDVVPQIDAVGRTMLPARWVAEAFDATVTWDQIQKVVSIRYYTPDTN